MTPAAVAPVVVLGGYAITLGDERLEPTSPVLGEAFRMRCAAGLRG